MVLNGNCTYTGQTYVNQGLLTVNGDNSRAGGAVTVLSGATLAGRGVIGGATVVEGTLAPAQMAFFRPLTLHGTTVFSIASATPPVGPGLLEVSYDNGLTYGGQVQVNFSTLLGPGNYNFKLFDFVGSASGVPSAVTIGGTYAATLARNNGIWTGDTGNLHFSFSEATGVLTVTAANTSPAGTLILISSLSPSSSSSVSPTHSASSALASTL
jgi:autotransporter-associated beta strand protein